MNKQQAAEALGVLTCLRAYRHYLDEKEHERYLSHLSTLQSVIEAGNEKELDQVRQDMLHHGVGYYKQSYQGIKHVPLSDVIPQPLSGQPAPDLEELKSALSTPVTGTNFLTQEDARRMFIIFDAAKAYLAMRSAQGMVMVPVEPTDEMHHAGYERISESLETGTIATCGDVYKAMIAARPKGE